MRLLVCGGRHYTDQDIVWRSLDGIHAKHNITCIIEGRRPMGRADLHAKRWAEARGIENIGFPTVSRQGPARNSRMLAEGRPTHCLAFPGERGASDMLHKAWAVLGRDRVHRVT